MLKKSDPKDWFKEIRIIDGGFGTEAQMLSEYQIDGHQAWSCLLLEKDPQLVLNIHKSYLRAGCDVISTNTYQAASSTLAEAFGVEINVAEGFMRKAVQLAKQAVDEFLEEEISSTDNSPPKLSTSYESNKCYRKLYPLVAGSLGPYGACLADGSEYSGSYVSSVSFEEMVKFHFERAVVLISAGIDFIAWETIPAAIEVHAIIEVMHRLPADVIAWISVVTNDGQNLVHGEPLNSIAAEINSCQKIFAVGVNCTVPHHLIGQALANVAGLEISNEENTEDHPPVEPATPSKILIAYANTGERYVVDSQSQSRSWVSPANSGPEDWAQSVSKCAITRSMLEREQCASACELSRRHCLAQWVGGCCRVRPNDILNLSKLIKPDEFNLPEVSYNEGVGKPMKKDILGDHNDG